MRRKIRENLKKIKELLRLFRRHLGVVYMAKADEKTEDQISELLKVIEKQGQASVQTF